MNYIRYIITIVISFLHLTSPVISINRVSQNVVVSPKKGAIAVGGSIQMMVEIPKVYVSCNLTTPKNENFVHYPTVSNNMNIVLNPDSPDRLTWLNYTCGVILSSVSNFSEGTWKFSVLNENNETFEDKSILSVIKPPLLETEMLAPLGSKITIDCTSATIYTTKPTYCRISNNNGQLVTEDCTFHISPVTLNDFGNWTCKMAITGTIEEYSHIFMIRKHDNDVLRYMVTKTDRLISLSCTLLESSYSFNWCRAVSPGGEQFLLTEGVLTHRYSALGTNLAKRQCGIEIKLPLNETDVGQWRLDFGTLRDFTGCFISTSSSKKKVSKSISNDVDKIRVSSGNSMILKCQVPWPISYCYARDPNENIVYASGFSAERIQRVGFCHVTVNNVTEAMSGRWTCGVSTFDGSVDTLFYRDVSVVSDRIVAEKDYIQAALGQDVILSCKSPVGEAMRYCRYVSPSGESFLLQPTTAYSTRLSHYGSLIKQGECGAQIKNVQIQDIGIWTCVTSFSAIDKDEYYAEITIKNQKPAIAFTIGMSIGGVIVFGLFVGILISMYRKQMTVNPRTENRSPSVSSDEPLSSGRDVRLYNLSTPVRRRSIEVMN